MLRNEYDLIRALHNGTITVDAGTITLGDLYQLAEEHGLADRPGGRKIIQDGQQQYRRRVRTALYAAEKAGKLPRRAEGEACWLVEGTRERPTRALFVWLPADPRQAELILGRATDILAQADEPIDLIVADPPWALRRGAGGDSAYARNNNLVVPGYVEVDSEEYGDFTAEWIAAAAKALRPGGYLAAITGPERSADVQVAAVGAGLTYVNSISVKVPFGVYSTRRFVHGHTRITLMTAGSRRSKRRVFNRPEEMPRGRKGNIYATDFWDDIPQDPPRTDGLRYDNALPTALVSRVIRSTTRRGDLVADPFLGSGTTLVTCLQEQRRFFGGDINPNSLRFTMGRVLDETIPAMQAATKQSIQQLELSLDELFDWPPQQIGATR